MQPRPLVARITGLPPAWIGVGALDILHDEAVDYAKRLAAADVPCDLEGFPAHFMDSTRWRRKLHSRSRSSLKSRPG
jgi:acetyl esterase/lipase